MPKKPVEETLILIEETQAALRDSIARAREYTAQSDRLVRKHREETVTPPSQLPDDAGKIAADERMSPPNEPLVS